MAGVKFDLATRQYVGVDRPAVKELSLEIDDGEFMVMVGPSGSGKSTALRMVAGLEPIDAGSVWIGDKVANRIHPKNRDVAMVFQSYALYPHMTVAENLGYALKVARFSKAEVKKRVDEVAQMLELTPLLNRKPRHLSGGERQRVAMGRAVVRRPQVFLMDEPLSNLDARLRLQTRTEIVSLQRRLGVTTIYVTHDQVEAMSMGDRVAVLRGGVLQQVGAPRELYDRPVNAFVAGFIGSPPMNLLPGVVDDGCAVVGDLKVPVPRDIVQAMGDDPNVLIGVRPESWVLSSDGGSPFVVSMIEQLGSDAFAYGTLVGVTTQVAVRVDPRLSPAPGDLLTVRPAEAGVHLFCQSSGTRLG